MRTEPRPGLPPLPPRIARLPLDPRGYPIPWFVATVKGKRDFRIADHGKAIRAVRSRLCWICGEPLGRYVAFVIGPMCVVNRNTSEPGCHHDCAQFAAQACPFLCLPSAGHRAANLPAGAARPPHHIDGNPGACAVYVTETFERYPVKGGWLIRLGEPVRVTWYTEGRPASRGAILNAFSKRLPILAGMAKDDGPEAERELTRLVAAAMQLLPPPTERSETHETV